ncbi:MAG: hypothetical protein E7L01_29050 [Paenibacillus macerans]|uniref:hypothetical protein n=1 Tax=Paenibacillus macerans TaxID=44252 RepID=UPI000EC74EDA|nr:hypothetical protein [Paenibacillus macerans]MBS5914877.1 hypothetical protein [Paenibacillus macerans]MDU5946133.1 hypothetical protein [Paenibacillus macerans]MDU7477350.1 hypothetical protein [Paenibacillus macerans]MEC0138733.1 hypothetical protein [Paenibacillus macerans]MEC0333629.1 hypothetical protein [Paenibacillus macerans]
MIDIVLLLLMLMAFGLWRDQEAMREEPPINRWFSYGMMAVSLGILLYTMLSPQLFYPSEWLGKVLRPLVPFP